MTLKEKLDLWVKITGVNPSEKNKKYTIYMDGRLSDFDIQKMNERIMNSLKYDETGLFADTYLKIYLKKFMNGKNVSFMELMENPDLQKYLKDVRTLYDSVNNSNAEETVLNNMKAAMDFYDLPSDKLTSEDVMSVVSSAKNCMNGKLKLDQITKGSFADDEFKGSLDIYMYKSIGDVIRFAAKGDISGISMCYICDDENLEQSFFAFVIKNGDNLYILSDRPIYKHPLRAKLSRCPGRDMSKRIQGNYFPYNSISGIDVSDLWGSGRYGVSKNDDNMTPAVNNDCIRTKIGTFASLKQDEAFWAIYMFSLIKDQFYKEHIDLEDLSYCEANIVYDRLEENKKNEIALRTSIPHIEMKPVENPNNIEMEYGRRPEHLYDYLIERYVDKVDINVFNLIKQRDKASHFLTDNELTRLNNRQYEALDLSSLRTENELIYDQQWLARYNMAVSIGGMLNSDFDKNKDRVISEMLSMIRNSAGYIVNLILTKKFDGEIDSFEYAAKYISYRDITLGKEYDDDYKSKYRCFFTGKNPAVVISFNAKTAEDLAILCGVDVKKIPIELQHYHRNKTCSGNNILDNIDPFDWALTDPYDDLSFYFHIILSGNEMLRRQAIAGVQQNAFWKEQIPLCYFEKYSFDKDRSYMNKKEANLEKEKYYNTCLGIFRGYDKNYRDKLLKKCEKCKYHRVSKNMEA